MIQASIANPNEFSDIPYQILKETCRLVLEGEGVKKARISIALVDNATIHSINKRFLDHDEPTDVITFPLSNSGASKLEGELVLGMEVAQQQAQDLGHSRTEELQLYVIHGLLHLVGYDDLTTKDIRAMRARERHYLQLLNLPDIASRETAGD